MVGPDRWLEFGEWLAGERKKTGLSQKQVAYWADLSDVQANRIEKGNSGVKRDTLIEIIEAINKHTATGYQIDPAGALHRAGFSPGESDEEIEERGMFKGYHELSPENKKRARVIIQTTIEQLSREEKPDTNYIDDGEVKNERNI